MSLCELRKKRKRQQPHQRYGKTEIHQISCSYRGIIMPFLFWSDGKIIRKSIRFLHKVDRTKVEQAKATHVHEESAKGKSEWERQRANYVWKIRAVGLFRVYISQEKYTHTRAHTCDIRSNACQQLFLFAIHKTHITFTHTTSDPRIYMPTHQPPINTHTYTQVFFVVD